MRRYVFYAFTLIALLTLAVWIISQFVQPVLPPSINTGLILFFAVLLAVIGAIAGFKDAVELIHLLFPQTNSTEQSTESDDTDSRQVASSTETVIASLERPGNEMSAESKFYIERPGDNICRRELQNQGVTIVVKAVQKMGKSSLLNRAIRFAQQYDKVAVRLDFRLLDDSELNSSERFYKGFCQWITNALDLPDKVELFWHEMPRLNDEALCTEYMHRYVLGVVNRPMTLAIDEVDRLLNCEFRSGFFAMLRHWHNQRAVNDKWRGLDLILVISTEPYILIDNLAQSPFNVGIIIRLEDFTFVQAVDLNKRYSEPFSESQLGELMNLLGGHPYLTHLAMFLVASGSFDAEDLITKATNKDGPFSEHLEHIGHLIRRPKLAQAMRQVIKYQICSDEDLFFRLHKAGLVLPDGNRTVSRCGLYEEYFRERLSL